MGQANGYSPGMGNTQETDTLAENITKYAHAGTGIYNRGKEKAPQLSAHRRKSAMNKKLLPVFALASLLLVACEQPPGTGFRAQETLKDTETPAKIGTDPEYPLNGNYTLGGNLILDEWTPIGTVDEPFAGTFAGNGKTIALFVSLAGARNNGSPQNQSGGAVFQRSVDKKLRGAQQ
jgi:hypothetical protein